MRNVKRLLGVIGLLALFVVGLELAQIPMLIQRHLLPVRQVIRLRREL